MTLVGGQLDRSLRPEAATEADPAGRDRRSNAATVFATAALSLT
jgi:hypothetical protein